MARTRKNKGHGMNPYQPPDADESQLDRIERKLDRLNGEFFITLIGGAGFGVMVIFLLEVLRVNGWKF
jgi:hypothetical protein